MGSNHRLTIWFGLEATLKLIWLHPPAHMQGPLPPAQGAPSPIQPGLEPCQGGAATASLGDLGQGLTTLIVKNFFLTSDLNLPSLNLKPSALVLSPHAPVTSPSPSLSQPLQALAAALRSPRSLPFPRLSSPSSPSLSSQQRGSTPRTVYLSTRVLQLLLFH